ncbi:ribosome assembly factor SBDS, partial [archaeon]|nr:ribosome assembly factor SBDS [archaeon]
SDGSLAAKVKIPAALRDNLYRKLGAITEGNARIEEVKGDKQ